jgi:hypothetical protein
VIREIWPERTGGAMSISITRVFKKAAQSKKMQLLFFAGIILFGLEILFESLFHGWLEINLFPKFFVRLLGGVGEILLLSFVFGIFFDFSEREELIDQAAEKYGMLGGLSQMGIKDFKPDSKEFDHREDFGTSGKLTVFLYGSKEFFINRFALIEERLKSGKEIIFVVHVGRTDGLKKLFELLRAMEHPDELYARMKFYTQPEDPSYNFVETDAGLWVKGYFLHQRNLAYGVPAFFVEKDTTMHARYRADIEENMKNWTLLEGKALAEFLK